MLTITVVEDERKVQDQIKETLIRQSNISTEASMTCHLQSYQNSGCASGIVGVREGAMTALGVVDTIGYNPAQYSPKYETSYTQFIDEAALTGQQSRTSGHGGKFIATTNIDTKASQITSSSHITINPILNFEHTHVIRYGEFL
jgi:hypothetical protein